MQKVDGVSNLADALTKHLQKGPLTSHMESVRLEIRDGRHPLMPACDSADKLEVSAAVSFESDEHLCQVALAHKFVSVKGLGPERGSTIAGRLFDLCCMNCKYSSSLFNPCCLKLLLHETSDILVFRFLIHLSSFLFFCFEYSIMRKA